MKYPILLEASWRYCANKKRENCLDLIELDRNEFMMSLTRWLIPYVMASYV